MSGANLQNGSDDGGLASRLRAVIDLATAAQVVLWVGLIAQIAWRTNPRGDGMDLAAVAPGTLIFLLGVGPGRGFRRRGWILPAASPPALAFSSASLISPRLSARRTWRGPADQARAEGV